MSENKEMPLKRREIWSGKGRKDEEGRSAEEGRYINQMKGNPRGGEGRGKLLAIPCLS